MTGKEIAWAEREAKRNMSLGMESGTIPNDYLMSAVQQAVLSRVS